MSVNWKTVDMQAKHNVDFIGGEGNLTFNHGETSKTLSFAIMDSMVNHHFYYFNSDTLFPFM